MNCNEALRLMTPYIKNELKGKTLEGFLDHVRDCSSCRDELEIYYVISKTVNDGTDSDDPDYDFKSQLEEKLEHSQKDLKRMRFQSRFENTVLAMLGLGFLGLVAYRVLTWGI